MKNIAFLGVTLWLLADAIDATANKQRWPPDPLRFATPH